MRLRKEEEEEVVAVVVVAVVAVVAVALEEEVPAEVLQGQVQVHHQEREQESVLAPPQEPELVQALEPRDRRLVHLLAQELAQDQAKE